jgi:hypothetical protein
VAAVVVLLTAVAGCGDLLPQLEHALGLGKAPETARLLDGADVTRTLTVATTPQVNHDVLDLGPAHRGEEWAFHLSQAGDDARLVVLAVLDEQYNVLRRESFASREVIRHVVRTDVNPLRIAVMTRADLPVTLEIVATTTQVDASTAQPQIVYLNFGGAQNLSINGRPAISFPRFDAATLGPAYAGATSTVQSVIAQTLRELFADYDVTFVSSAEAPAPTAPHSTIHFGGGNPRQLGFSDGVDWSNADPRDEAVVYVENLAAYQSMDLSTEEIGRMIGNVAGHELGHLLGLCHVRGAHALMDESRNAWELAGESTFDSAPVAPAVFPIGFQDGHAALIRTVGPRSPDQSVPAD